jgi:hypothetical protein
MMTSSNEVASDCDCASSTDLERLCATPDGGDANDGGGGTGDVGRGGNIATGAEIDADGVQWWCSDS